MKSFWKWTVIKNKDLDKFLDYAVTARVAEEEGRKSGFKEGVNHLYDQLYLTITTNNPNRLFATGFLSKEQMIFLFKAIAGDFVRGKKSS